MHGHLDAPPEVENRFRAICSALPEVQEQRAWVGTRWRIRAHTFAHVLAIDDGWPPSYARVCGTDGPAVVFTFQAEGFELDALAARDGFVRPRWRSGIVAMVFEPTADPPAGWDEIGELVTESYCLLAPQKLVDLVERPD